ncbi:MAG: peptidylprolyl isomerase [Lentisphaerales bacterium]|nr:peptidylprolyl isomerase [Lentisphaerales bacterium]
MKINDNAVVSVDFEMTNQDGKLIDSTEEGGAMVYLHGHENIIPELEKNLAGLEAGAEFTVELSPEQAFGKKSDDKIFTVSKSDFETPDLKLGMQFQTVDSNNQPIIATIVDLKGDKVIIDENHPLAGMTLTFKGNVQEVREATLEEISHGHIHQPKEESKGGCCGSC